jgi:hypothetical protein
MLKTFSNNNGIYCTLAAQFADAWSGGLFRWRIRNKGQGAIRLGTDFSPLMQLE